MALSNGTRHRAEAVTALLLAARASIDATLATLEQASRLASQDEPEGDPTSDEPKPAPPVSRRPRSPKRVRDASATPLVVKPEPAAPSVVDPGLQFQINPLAQRILTALEANPAGGIVARVLATHLTDSASVAAHGPIYAEVDRLVASGLVEKDGRRYRLRRAPK